MGRARSSSLVKVETVGQNSQEEDLDQGVYDNVNAEWVNRKGMHTLFSLLPPMTIIVACSSFQVHG